MVEHTKVDLDARYEKLSESGDPLVRLKEMICWDIFRPMLKKALRKTSTSVVGRKAFDYVLMFKILVLQSLYNLSDAQMEYQIRDRLSFIRFLDLRLEDVVPDEKTVWLFRERLMKAQVLEKLFNRFNEYLERQGLAAKVGSIVDASIVEVPRQRNSRDENKEIKEGKLPESWKENANKLRQKDVDARWTQKGGQNYYGYKNHVNVDVKHKLIRKYEVTPASTADIRCVEKLLDERNAGKKLWGDKAYRSAEVEKLLEDKGYQSRIHYKPRKGGWIAETQVRWNHRYSKIRARVEHVFGFIVNTMRGDFIRTIGMSRAQVKIGMNNLVYNFCRYGQLLQVKTV